MLIWILLAALLIGLSIILLLLAQQDGSVPESARRFNEVLETPQDEGWLNQRKWRKTRSVTHRFRRMLERTPGSDMEEIEVLMRQAAMVDDAARGLVYVSLWLTPALGILAGLALGAAHGGSLAVGGMFGLGFGYIAPRRALRWAAKRRQRSIREEMPIVLNLMRLLFDAGLSIEHTMKAISEQGKRITPHLAREFAWVLMRIHHGQDRGDALEEMAKRIDVPELTETVAILKQAARYGGSVRDSLLKYLKLMEDRRLTDLRDKVGKLSAQMTVVMVLFLFPALLIFLAGPGVLAITKALTTMR